MAGSLRLSDQAATDPTTPPPAVLKSLRGGSVGRRHEVMTAAFTCSFTPLTGFRSGRAPYRHPCRHLRRHPG